MVREIHSTYIQFFFSKKKIHFQPKMSGITMCFNQTKEMKLDINYQKMVNKLLIEILQKEVFFSSLHSVKMCKFPTMNFDQYKVNLAKKKLL